MRDMWQSWGLSREHPLSRQPGAGPVLRAGAAADRRSRWSQGKITGEQAGELAANVAKEWRDFNPDMVENYKKWAADLSADLTSRAGSAVPALPLTTFMPDGVDDGRR